MKINASALFVGSFLVLGVAATIWQAGGSSKTETPALVVAVPQLSLQAKRGEKAFNANCSGCHGENASGSEQGPPLIHDIYNPGHHADEGFRRAVKLGVRRHHWPFGDMPRQEQVKPSEIESIIVYIRELQVANGIFTKPHSM